MLHPSIELTGGSGLTGAGHSPGCAPVAVSSSAGEKTVEPYLEQ
ncbi:conserved hypothetical protein [Xenorhabdus nematophila F1]|nr:conserved hypothetical protein [Xenorhabdus nematophila F1]